MVLDGEKHSLKGEVEDSRESSRDKASRKAVECWQHQDSDKAARKLVEAMDVTPALGHQLIQSIHRKY